MKKSLALLFITLLLLLVSFGCSQPGIRLMESDEFAVSPDLRVKEAAEDYCTPSNSEAEEPRLEETEGIREQETLINESPEMTQETKKEPQPCSGSETVTVGPNTSGPVISEPEKAKPENSEPVIPEENEEPIVYCEFCGKVLDDGRNGTCIRREDYICVVCGAETGWMECHTCGETIVEKAWIPDQAEIDELYLELKNYVLDNGWIWENTMNPENGSWCGWYESNSGPYTSRSWIERNVKGEIKVLYEMDGLTTFHVYIERINETQWRFYVLW